MNYFLRNAHSTSYVFLSNSAVTKYDIMDFRDYVGSSDNDRSSRTGVILEALSATLKFCDPPFTGAYKEESLSNSNKRCLKLDETT